MMGDGRRSAGWLVAGIAALAVIPGRGGGAAWAQAVDGVEMPRLVHLPPGAEVGTGPPPGWSDRVIRSAPRLASGDLGSLPDSARATATLLRTVIAADVVGRPGAYALGRVGVGNAVPAGGREVVVTPEGPAVALEALGIVGRIVLQAAEAKLGEGRLIARTPTFALYRAPSVLLRGGRHQDVDLHYALRVDPANGALTAMVWAVPTGSAAAPAEVVVLPPGLNFNLPLDVQVTRSVGPLPVAWSFAMGCLPPGRTVAVPAAIGAEIAAAERGEADPAILERALDALAAGR